MVQNFKNALNLKRSGPAYSNDESDLNDESDVIRQNVLQRYGSSEYSGSDEYLQLTLKRFLINNRLTTHTVGERDVMQ